MSANESFPHLSSELVNLLTEAGDKTSRSRKQINPIYDDFFFLTDPSEFIYWCHPDKSKWQLLNKPLSKEEFAALPYCTEQFFRHKLDITSNASCLMKSVNGNTSVSIRTKRNASRQIPLTCALYFNERESELSSEKLGKYIAIMNSDSSTTFDIRLPLNGTYELMIIDDNEEWVAFFKIVRESSKNICRPFPVKTDIGYGPNAGTISSGLMPDTHKSGLIILRPLKQIQFGFIVQGKLHVKTTLVHSAKHSEDLDKYVSHRLTKDYLTIYVEVPTNAEYALQIYVQGKDSDQDRNVCNYLLSSDDPKKKKRRYEVVRMIVI